MPTHATYRANREAPVRHFTAMDDYLVHQTAGTVSEMGHGERAEGWNEHMWVALMPSQPGRPLVVFRWVLYPNAGASGYLRAAAHVNLGGRLHTLTVERPLAHDRGRIEAGPLAYDWVVPASEHRVALAANDGIDAELEAEIERRGDVQLGPDLELVTAQQWTHTLQWLRVKQGRVRVGGESFDLSDYTVWKDHCWGNMANESGLRGDDEPSYWYAWAALPLPDRTLELAASGPNTSETTRTWGKVVWDDGRAEWLEELGLEIAFDTTTRRFTHARWELTYATGEKSEITIDPHLHSAVFSERDYGADRGPEWAGELDTELRMEGQVWELPGTLADLPIRGWHAVSGFAVDGEPAGYGWLEWMVSKDSTRCGSRGAVE